MKRWPVIFLLLPVLLLGACGGKDAATPENPGGGGGLVNPIHPEENPGEDPGGEDPGGGDGGQEEEDPEAEGHEKFTLTVASCNVLKPSGRRDEMSLDEPIVRETLAKSIESTNADIIGFNELDEYYQYNGKYSLEKSCDLSNMAWNLAWPNRINHYSSFYYTTYSYANGFAYNKTLIEVEDSGYVWLSKTGAGWYTNPKSAYGLVGNPDRTCVWVKMKHIPTGRHFWLFVTHLPTDSQGGAANMAEVVNYFASDKAGKFPAILTGDMNYGPKTTPYTKLTSYWKDGSTLNTGTLSGSSANYYYTVSVFTKNHPERRIDHIMTRGCTASNYHTVVETYTYDDKVWCPSDHLPVVATVTIE